MIHYTHYPTARQTRCTASGAGTLVGKVLDNYEKLSEELRAELPLKHIWALVLEEE